MTPTSAAMRHRKVKEALLARRLAREIKIHVETVKLDQIAHEKAIHGDTVGAIMMTSSINKYLNDGKSHTISEHKALLDISAQAEASVQTAYFPEKVIFFLGF